MGTNMQIPPATPSGKPVSRRTLICSAGREGKSVTVSPSAGSLATWTSCLSSLCLHLLFWRQVTSLSWLRRELMRTDTCVGNESSLNFSKKGGRNTVMKGLLRIKILLYILYKQHPLGKEPDSWLGIILPSPTNEFLLLPCSKPHKQRSSL